MPKDIKIGLLWHSANCGNLGVGALTIANMAIVRGVAEELGLTPRFTILQVRDDGPVQLQPDEARSFIIDTRSLLNPGAYFATVKAQDCVLDIGGGDSFTDIYADRRYAFIWLTKALTILAGTPLMLCPQTIGPFSRQPHTAMAKWAMRHSAAVIARDHASLAATQEMAPKTPRLLCADVAFGLPYDDQSRLRNGAKVRVGFNVSGLMFNQATSGANKFGLDVNYADLTRRLITDFLAKGAEVSLFSHVMATQPWDDDGATVDLLAREFPEAIRLPDFPGPCEAKTYISGLDFLVSGRMHSCIAAVSSGTPCVPIAYSRKFSGVFGLVDYPWLVDTAGKTTDDAYAYVMSAFDDRATLAADCQRAIRKVDDLMNDYKAEIRGLFQRLSKA